VLWKVFTGDNSTTSGHYNWASPLIYNGYAYIGVTSYGDCPLVQGQLLQVSLSTHQVVNTLNLVVAGHVGAGIWTSPSVDSSTNTIYVTTGTKINTADTLAEAIVAVDATTLAVKSSWQIPAAQETADSDWGTTPILFDDANCRHLVAGINKNGILYAFDRANLAAVPCGSAWSRSAAPVRSAETAALLLWPSPTAYSTSPPAKHDQRRRRYSSSVRAVDPTTGNYLWQHGDLGVIIPRAGLRQRPAGGRHRLRGGGAGHLLRHALL
jgi:hypothetical protein